MSNWTSYLYAKDNVSALNILRAGDLSGLPTSRGELEATRKQVMVAGQAFISVLCGQRRGTTVGEARYRLYTMMFGKLLKVICRHL